DQVDTEEFSRAQPGEIGRRRTQPRRQIGELTMPRDAPRLGVLGRDRNKADRITWSALPETWQIDRDDRGDLRIAAGCLPVGHEHDHLARPWYLHAAGSD